MTDVTLSMSGGQHRALKAHLFPGDGKEAVAIALCGRRAGRRSHRLLVRSLHLVDYAACTERSEVSVAWPTDIMTPWLEEAARRSLSVVKFHSHLGGERRFSLQDDRSDGPLFESIAAWVAAEVPHASAIMLPDGQVFGRVYMDGDCTPLASVRVVGADLLTWYRDEMEADTGLPLPAFTRRHAQAFGTSTTRRLGRMSAAVIGCSGTGSIVIEQLVRLGVGHLVIIDDDHVKVLNLNRILNACLSDAERERFKVEVLAEAIERFGLKTEVEVHTTTLEHPDAVRAVAECDVIFGCVDSATGRFFANLLSNFYTLPYIDVGVTLEADANGAITQVCGYVHYLEPGASSLLSRGAISMDEVRSEGLRRSPDVYEEYRRAGYIQGVQEDRPAVISVNMVLAGLAVNEFLARLHGFRDEPNSIYGSIGVSISQVAFYPEAESGIPCKVMARQVGRGDVIPLLEQPELSEQG